MKPVFAAVLLLVAAGAAAGAELCCAPLPANLAGWWTFDEPSGPASADFGGAVNNAGADNGVVMRGAGKVGRAVAFEGATWIHVRNHAEIDFAGDCTDGTIDFWIRTTESRTVAVLDKRERGNNLLQGYEVYLWRGRIGFQMATGAGNLSCGSSGSACTNFTSPFAVNDGHWHFVAIAFTSCGDPRGTFYVDGQTAPFTPRLGSISSNADLVIGREVPNLSGTFFRGSLDELEIVERALSKPELDAIYEAGAAGKCR